MSRGAGPGGRISIDVVIPSIRHDARKLLSAMAVRVPGGVDLRWFIVSDNPSVGPGSLEHCGFPVRVIAGGGMGAPAARNAGIAAGRGDYILFLDDDVAPSPDILHRYADAIRADPGAAGYVGPTRFPEPTNAFTRGVRASDMLTFFCLPAGGGSAAWGTTSNLMVPRRNAGAGFSAEFPKHGGGEDIDFCFRAGKGNAGTRLFRAVPGAYVEHPWWGGGRRGYRRFFRWGFGDMRLPRLHPEHRYYGPPGTLEMLLFGTPAAACAEYAGILWGGAAAAYACSVAAGEFAGERLRARATRPGASARSSAEATLVRLSNEAGKLAGVLRHGELSCLFARFDYFGDGATVRFERAVAAAKLSAPAALAAAAAAAAAL